MKRRHAFKLLSVIGASLFLPKLVAQSNKSRYVAVKNGDSIKIVDVDHFRRTVGEISSKPWKKS